MNITTRTGLLGFLLVLSALSVPAANATTSQPTANVSPLIEGRLNRIAAAIRQREAQWQDAVKPGDEILMARGFADGSRGGGWNQFARGGTATGAGGGTFANAHPNYGGGGGGFANGGAGFRNGAYGGAGFANAAYGGTGAAFANGAYGGAGFANGSNGGAGFRNW